MKLNRFQNKRLSRNKKGSIEGLPLQLMILIIIATLGTAVIIGWMGNIETPSSIGDVTVDTNEIRLSGTASNGYYTTYSPVKICVTDQNGNPLEGATIVLMGLGVTDANNNTAYKTTDNTGCVSFNGLKIKLGSSNIGFITANVSKAGYGEDSSCRLTVIA
ncbi:MAG: carboxypeptidase-like regulatory domain-containing protein [Candidatus Methanomethylophilaceae archaeon]|jgi:hypothetical protein